MMIPDFAKNIIAHHISGVDKEEQKTMLEDVITYGCSASMVDGTIYNHNIDRHFINNLEEILEFLDDYEEETGSDIMEMIKQRSDNPYTELPGQAVWMAVEFAAQDTLREMEEEEN